MNINRYIWFLFQSEFQFSNKSYSENWVGHKSIERPDKLYFNWVILWPLSKDVFGII